LSRNGALVANEGNDLRINSWAADAQLQWKGYPEAVRHTRATRDDLEAFETVYNAACLSIAKGEFAQGELLLKRAKGWYGAVLIAACANVGLELCRTSEDLTPEDRAAELLPIAVQQLYVLISQGKSEEAGSILDEITVKEYVSTIDSLLDADQTSIPELSTRNIAQNNVALARNIAANPYLLYKTLHETPDTTDNDKLFDFQNSPLVGNSFSSSLLVQKYDGIIRSTSKALSHSGYPSAEPMTNLLSVYNAAAHAQDQTGTKSLKHILPLLERRPKDLGLLLTVVQLYVTAGNTTSAIAMLERSLQTLEESISEQDKDVRFNPGLLGVLVSLYKLEGRKVQVRTELSKAASYWRERSEPPVSLLRAAGASLLHSSDRSDLALSGELFKALYQNDANDRFAGAGYVASQATIDYAKVESQIGSLPPVQDLISDVDVAALESSGISPTPSTAAAAAAAIAGVRKRPSGGKDGRATKRIRKSRLPKDYDPNKTPDPERWLPLRDRSTYRPKGRKGKQRAAERTQGGVVSEKQEETPAAAAPKAPAGGGASSKKKKKGKR
jgi:signal recognition particle subunit SRP72